MNFTIMNPLPKDNKSSTEGPKPTINLANFFHIYFNFTCYTLCTPFRIARSKSGNEDFELKKALHQRALCFLSYGLSILAIVHRCRKTLLEYFEKVSVNDVTPALYFHTITRFVINSYRLFTMKKFCFDGPQYLRILNFLQNDGQSLSIGNMKIQRKPFVILICAIATCLAIMRVMRLIVMDSSSTWSSPVWNQRLMSHSRFTFFMVNNVTEMETILESDQIYSLDYFLVILHTIGQIHATFQWYIQDLSLLMTVLTVWTAVKIFSQNLQNEIDEYSTEANAEATDIQLFICISNIRNQSKSTGTLMTKKSWAEIYEMYLDICTLCQLVNEAFGSMFTFYMTIFLLDMSTSLDKVLTTATVMERIGGFYFIFLECLIFVLAADVCKRMNELINWTEVVESMQTFSDIEGQQKRSAVARVRNREIGISCGNTFVITYSILWNVGSTMVTYFVICLQNRNHK